MTGASSQPQRKRRRGRLVLAAAAALVTLSLSAAQSPPATQASRAAQEKPQAEAALAGAQEAMEGKDYATASMLLESFLFVYPGHVGALFNLAYCYSLQGRFADAMDLYRQTLEMDPTLIPARMNLGLLLLDRDKPAEAVAEFDQVLEAEPRHPHAHLYRGAALERLGYKDKALEEYRQAAELDPQGLESRRAALKLLLQEEKWEPAEKVVRELLALSPAEADLYSLEAGLLENQGKTAEALAAYESYFEREAAGSSASRDVLGELHLRAGRLARQMGKPEDALRHFQAAQEQGSGQSAQTGRIEQAETLASLQRWSEAIPLYAAALEKQPENADLRATLGHAYLEDHQYEPAARELLAALRLDPERVETYNHLASALYLSGALAGAIEILDRRAARAQETPATLFLRAISYDKLHQCGPAIAYYEKFLAGNKDESSDQYFQATGRLRALKRSCRDRRRQIE